MKPWLKLLLIFLACLGGGCLGMLAAYVVVFILAKFGISFWVTLLAVCACPLVGGVAAILTGRWVAHLLNQTDDNGLPRDIDSEIRTETDSPPND